MSTPKPPHRGRTPRPAPPPAARPNAPARRSKGVEREPFTVPPAADDADGGRTTTAGSSGSAAARVEELLRQMTIEEKAIKGEDRAFLSVATVGS